MMTPNCCRSYRPPPNVELNWPLLRGYGRDAASVGELAAEQALVSTKHSASHRVSALTHTVVVLFWNSLAAQQSVSRLAQMEQEMAAFVGVIADRVRIGEVSPQVKLNADVDLAVRRLDLQEKQDALFYSQERLRLALGITDERDLIEPIGTLPAVGSVTVSEADMLQIALENRTDLQALNSVVTSQEVKQRAAENALLPQLDLKVGLDSVGLLFSRPLENTTAKGQVSERRAALHRSRLEVALLREQIKADVRDALHRLKSTEKAYLNAKKTHELIQSMAESTRQQVSFGEQPYDSVVGAQDRVTKSTLQIISTNLKYAVALADLRLATGTVASYEHKDAADIAADFSRLPDNY